jgi:glycosyltransferase involved in cell wall biosynthesis
MHYHDFPLCRALAEQGVDLTLFTCDETHVPPGLPFPVELAFQGIFGQAPAWLRGMRYGLALARIARSRSRRVSTIVHVNFLHALPLDYAFLAWMRSWGSRLVVSAHDVRPFDVQDWGMGLVRRIYRMADVVIAHSQAGRKTLLDLGLAPDHAVVVPLGHYLDLVDEARPTAAMARQQLGLPLDAPVLLFFGQIKEVKGLDVLLRALPDLIERWPKLRLVIAGKVWKDDWARYANLIKELDLARWLELHLRHIADGEVPFFFAAADAVALPYRHVYQSAVLLMALSHACPVVATRVGGLAEVVRDGETGYLVPPQDPQALAVAASRLLSEPQAARAMGQRGRALVKERHSWTHIATQIRQVYERALVQ